MGAKKRKPTDPAGPGNTFSGNFTAGHDQVFGGPINFHDQRAVQVASPPQFIAELQRLHQAIAELPRQAQLNPTQQAMLETAHEQVGKALEEAHQPQPVGARISATLTGAKAMLEQAGGAVAAAVKLGAALAALGEAAIKIFGG